VPPPPLLEELEDELLADELLDTLPLLDELLEETSPLDELLIEPPVPFPPVPFPPVPISGKHCPEEQ